MCPEVHEFQNSIYFLQVGVRLQHLGATTGQVPDLLSRQVDEVEVVVIHWTHQWHVQILSIQHGVN